MRMAAIITAHVVAGANSTMIPVIISRVLKIDAEFISAMAHLNGAHCSVITCLISAVASHSIALSCSHISILTKLILTGLRRRSYGSACSLLETCLTYSVQPFLRIVRSETFIDALIASFIVDCREGVIRCVALALHHLSDDFMSAIAKAFDSCADMSFIDAKVCSLCTCTEPCS